MTGRSRRRQVALTALILGLVLAVAPTPATAARIWYFDGNANLLAWHSSSLTYMTGSTAYVAGDWVINTTETRTSTGGVVARAEVIAGSARVAHAGAYSRRAWCMWKWQFPPGGTGATWKMCSYYNA